jgi:methionyl-tRNA synthetase
MASASAKAISVPCREGWRMQHGYKCEDCEVAIFPTTTRSELVWLKDRTHIAREVSKHSSTGLDSWMMEGLEFLEDHRDHSIVLVSRR